MTYKEAIEILKRNKPTRDPRLCGKELCTACDVAIEALEKQIPKKPVDVEDKMWGCPICSNHLLRKWREYPTEPMPKSLGLPHCMSCGQAIDWSEEE